MKNIYTILGIATAIGLLLLLSKFFGKSDQEKMNEDEIKDIQLSPSLMTISEQDALSIANMVHNAMAGVGTGTHEILNAFKIPFVDYVLYYTWDVSKSPFNRYDLMAIKKKFGVRSGETIGQWLANEVDPVPYQAVNQLYNYKNTVL